MADGETPNFASPLPGNEATWSRSGLGSASKWPKALQTLSLTISAFAYPAAIFFGEEFFLLHNELWASAGGAREQGQAQRGRLSSDAWNALSASLHGGKPRKLQSHQILRAEQRTKENYTVLLSPVFDETKTDQAAGVLAQLMPKFDLEEESNESVWSKSASVTNASNAPEEQENDAGEYEGALDKWPLDEHPFFHRFAEMLPTGLAILDHKARAIFVNQHFYELTTHHNEDKSFKSWPYSIHPEDYERVMNAYQEAFRSQKQFRAEFRSLGERYPWRLLLLTPLGDENLKHVSLREYGGFVCCVVDISSEKSAELAERKAAKDASERKDQQERFIDMISHEIRNPLSAILHCIEDIEAEIQPSHGPPNNDDIRQAIETIDLCISHQRNIVDDVLSFSKLDSSMLSLAPKPSQISRELANSLKMFQPEFRKQSIEFDYSIDKSYDDSVVSWVMADLARVSQILINLVTNAIKFTVRKEGIKEISISVAASTARPTSYPPNVVFFNADDLSFRLDATNSTEWGNGETLYMMVAVKDTGIGISEEGQQRLFERFRQATPKTEEVYGGSGLGLNISRKLCHLHGGEIGVASKEGVGSTFGFFFKVKRASAPNESNQLEKEQKEEDEVYEQIDSQGLACPLDMDQSEVPQTLKTPPITLVKESARSHSSFDEKYKKTAKVASRVEEADSDPYANAERPRISKEHRSGECWQSNDVAKDGKFNNAIKPSDIVSSIRPSPYHVLLAEDNIINQRIVFRKLEKQGFNVTTANNGREALDGLRNAPNPSSGDKGSFDIVLMDQEMPMMDGNAATKEIRELEARGELEYHIPILGVTANVREEQQNEMLASGMDDIISKPYKIEELVEKINRMLDNSNHTRNEP